MASLFAFIIILLALNQGLFLGIGMAFFILIVGDNAGLLSLFAVFVVILALSQRLFLGVGMTFFILIVGDDA